MTDYRPSPSDPTGMLVGSDGTVWTCRKRVSLGGNEGSISILDKRWKPVATHFNGKYLRVSNRRVKKYVHCLVAEAFLGPRPPGCDVLHANDIKTDNRVDNLRYGSRQENMKDASRNGRIPLGSARPNAKLTDERVREIRALPIERGSQARYAREHNIPSSTVSLVWQRKRWAHVQ